MKKNSNSFDLRKQEKKIVLTLLFGILLYSLFTIFADARKIFSLAFKFNWGLLPLLITLSLLNYLLRAVRFHYLLAKINVKMELLTSLKIFLSGISMTLTPGKTGEIIKAYLVKKHSGNKFSEMIPLIIFERFTDGVAMIILATAGVYFYHNFTVFLILSLIPPFLFYFLIKSRKHILKLVKLLEKRIPKLQVLEHAIVFFDNAEILITPKIFSIATIISLAAWFLEGYALFTIINFYLPYSFKNLFLALFIFSFSSIAGFFALIPGGLGVAEGSITYLATLFFKLPLSKAIFITLLFRSVTLWFGVILGSLTLLYTIKHLPENK